MSDQEKTTPAKPKKEKKEAVLDSGNYIFVSNGKSKHMPIEGQEFEVDSKEAEILINKGYGEIKA